MYHDLVNAVRQQIPANVRHVATKVTAIAGDAAGQRITLATGDEIEARLVIMATGLNPGLRDQLEIKREVLSPCHSISIGFDMKPEGDQPFAFPALTVFPERPDQSMAYLTVFPVQGGMRANLFVYWGMEDTRLRKFRHQPKEALLELIPTLTQFTGPFTIDGQVSIRPIDLVRVNAPRKAGHCAGGRCLFNLVPGSGNGRQQGSDRCSAPVLHLCAGVARQG